MSRQVATDLAATGESSRYVAQLEPQLEIARDEREFLREQINRKDRTIRFLSNAIARPTFLCVVFKRRLRRELAAADKIAQHGYTQ